MKVILVKHFSQLLTRVEKFLIFLFFATFPLNIRKVFPTFLTFPKGEFNEYLTLSFCWSDALILFLIIIYITKYINCQYKKPAKILSYGYNNNEILSSIIKRNTFLLRSVILKLKETIFSFRNETFFLFLFLVWSALSIFWAPFRIVAIYRLFIILIIVSFVYIIGKLIKKDYVYAEFLYIGLFTGGIIQSLIGIWQFLLNRSLGLKLLGESILGPELPGVAKIIVSGVKHIRAYGTFPHPNVLAGFILIQLVLLTAFLRKSVSASKSTQSHHNELTPVNFWRLLFHRVSLNVSLNHSETTCGSNQKNPPEPEGIEPSRAKKVPRETILSKIPSWIFALALLINMICFALTFSRSALLSLALVALVLLLLKMAYSARRIWLVVAIIVLAVLLHGFISYPPISSNFVFSTQSMEERVPYLNVSQETISGHPWLGVGLGQFVFQEIVSRPAWPGWQYQPVHNIYLLITSELGIIGLMLFLLFLLTYLYNYCFMRITPVLLTSNFICVILLSFLFIFFFDHYFWDIKPGMIIFAIPFILSRINYPRRENIIT